MCGILIIRGNSEATLQWDARVLWVFAWAIITLTHHVLGKCRQYSAVQRRDGWCVCRHCWTVDPIISWGRKGGARHHRREIKDDWLNQNRGPSWTACACIYWETIVRANATAQWWQRAVTGSQKIKCNPFLKWGRGGIFMWREKLPVIKNISQTCWDSSPAEIRNTSLLQAGRQVLKTHKHQQTNSHYLAQSAAANLNSQTVTDTTADARDAEGTQIAFQFV